MPCTLLQRHATPSEMKTLFPRGRTTKCAYLGSSFFNVKDSVKLECASRHTKTYPQTREALSEAVGALMFKPTCVNELATTELSSSWGQLSCRLAVMDGDGVNQHAERKRARHC